MLLFKVVLLACKASLVDCADPASLNQLKMMEPPQAAKRQLKRIVFGEPSAKEDTRNVFRRAVPITQEQRPAQNTLGQALDIACHQAPIKGLRGHPIGFRRAARS